MSENDLQLQMNFSEKGNEFRSRIGSGKFSLLIENPVPCAEIPQEESLKKLQTLEQSIAEIKDLPCGLAILDRSEQPNGWNAVEYASQLPEERRGNHVVYLSGFGKTREEVTALLHMAEGAGLPNLVPVSGDLAEFPVNRTESAELLEMMLAVKGLHPGITVNPYQYDPWALMAQYYKLAVRLRKGANFFIAQAGWDMLKLQSLSWFLLNRQLFTPAFARLILLTPERMEKLLSGSLPGISIPHEMQLCLEKELCFSRNQFESAQLRRLELQAAGCRMLGFSGVQIAGADTPGLAAVAAHRIAETLQKIKTFDDFLNCYNAEMAEYESDSFENKFHLFDRVLRRSYPFDNPPVSNELPPAGLGCSEKLIAGVKHTFGIEKDSRMKRRFSICTGGACPKGIFGGPCGGVNHDGSCEEGTQECVYRKWCRHANSKGELASVEEELFQTVF